MKHFFTISMLFASILANGQNVVQIPTVFHVLWNEPSDNIPDSLIHQTLDLVNKDFRRQNEDTVLTPERFLPLAVDTEIEFVLATTNPDGSSTDGITRTYTDSTEFLYSAHNMNFSASGGQDAWNTCTYLNVWIVPAIASEFGFAQFGHPWAEHPGGDTFIDGAVITPNFFDGNYPNEWRTLTQLMAMYLDLYFINGQSCIDVDSVADTPISTLNPLNQQYDCQDTIITCSNAPEGDMFMNFMSNRFETCTNMFTIGQKDRMHTTLTDKRPGLINPSLCGLTVRGRESELIEVYPNPTQAQLNFQSSEKSNLSVLDLSGRTVLTSVASKGKNRVDVESLPSGIYFLRLESDQAVSSTRFVKN